MKNSIILTGILLFTLSSCSDMLDLPSQTQLSTGTYFNSQSDFEKAVNGVYEPMRTLYNAGGNGNNGAVVMGELHSDNARYSYNLNFRATTDQEDIADFIYDAASANITQKYRSNYLIIARANEVLVRIDAMDFDQVVKDNLKGQCLFMRAFSYFDLVQYFGEVPMHLVPSTSFEDVALPLAPVNEVYTQIISDASEAASLLPSVVEQHDGRATSGAANTLLGNVYIVLKEWNNAETALTKVTGYGLMDDYADVFNPANKDNSEMIFAAQFSDATTTFASTFMNIFWSNPISAAEITTIYEDNGIPVPPNVNSRNGAGINIPTPDLIDAYEVGDLRKEATIGFGIANGQIVPFAKKYLQPCADFFRENANWPIYRYSEVLLFLAEAIHNQGRDGEALPYINQVRDRAGLAALTALTDANILQERRVELALEAKRWPDLVRMDIVETMIGPYGERIRANPQDYYFPGGVELRANAFQNFSKTFPLPSAEALLSPYF